MDDKIPLMRRPTLMRTHRLCFPDHKHYRCKNNGWCSMCREKMCPYPECNSGFSLIRNYCRYYWAKFVYFLC